MEFFLILSVSLRKVRVGHSRFKFATFACAPKGTSSYQYCQLRFYGSAKFFFAIRCQVSRRFVANCLIIEKHDIFRKTLQSSVGPWKEVRDRYAEPVSHFQWKLHLHEGGDDFITGIQTYLHKGGLW